MLSLNEDFEDVRAIKVLVVPIGENTLFDVHFNVVSRLRNLPLYELNRPSTWKANNQALKHFNWTTGSLLFDYLRYDRVPNGPGDLDHFQCSKRVLMIMGLVNYPELSDTNIEDELSYFSRRHQNVIICRVFVFNYSFDLATFALTGLKNDSNSVVIFPPDGDCEGGSMVAVHLQEVMGHASVRIIESLESQLKLCEDYRNKGTVPSDLSLSTFHDDIEEVIDSDSTSLPSFSTGSSKQFVPQKSFLGKRQNSKRRVLERLRKWMGDLCLQVCSPLDALEHYSASIAEAKLNGKCLVVSDCLWLGGALEGYSISALLLFNLGFPIEEILSKGLSQIHHDDVITIEHKLFSHVEERCSEALALYCKSVVLCTLEVELSLRLARMHEKRAFFGKDHKVMECVMRASSVPGLNSQQQIECVLEGGFICRRLGLNRKYALLMYVASLMSAENDNPQLSHSLMRSTCKLYGVSVTPRFESEQSDMDLTLQDTSLSWASMRKAIYSHCAYFAGQCSDFLSAAKFTCALIQLIMVTEQSNIKQFSDANKFLLESLYFERLVQNSVGYLAPSRSLDSISIGVGNRFVRTTGSSFIKEFDAGSNVTPVSSQFGSLDGNSEMTDMALAKEVIRDGFRRMATPKIPPKLVEIVRSGRNRLRNQMRIGQVSESNRLDDENVVALCDGGVLDSTFAVESECDEDFSTSAMFESRSSYYESQEEALSALECVSQQLIGHSKINLPVSFSFLCPCLLSANGIRPTPLPEETAFLATRGSAIQEGDLSSVEEAKKSALFYDPFAAQRAKREQSSVLTEVIWSVGDVGKFCLCIHNPLLVPIHYDRVEVALEGPDHISLPSAIDIPPNSKHSLYYLSAVPLKPGSLKVVGLKVFVNNAFTILHIDSSGNSTTDFGSLISSPWKFQRALPPLTGGISRIPKPVDCIGTNMIEVVCAGNSFQPAFWSRFDGRPDAIGSHSINLDLAPGEVQTVHLTLEKSVSSYRSSECDNSHSMDFRVTVWAHLTCLKKCPFVLKEFTGFLNGFQSEKPCKELSPSEFKRSCRLGLVSSHLFDESTNQIILAFELEHLLCIESLTIEVDIVCDFRASSLFCRRSNFEIIFVKAAAPLLSLQSFQALNRVGPNPLSNVCGSRKYPAHVLTICNHSDHNSLIYYGTTPKLQSIEPSRAEFIFHDTKSFHTIVAAKSTTRVLLKGCSWFIGTLSALKWLLLYSIDSPDGFRSGIFQSAAQELSRTLTDTLSSQLRLNLRIPFGHDLHSIPLGKTVRFVLEVSNLKAQAVTIDLHTIIEEVGRSETMKETYVVNGDLKSINCILNGGETWFHSFDIRFLLEGTFSVSMYARSSLNKFEWELLDFPTRFHTTFVEG